MKIARTMAAAGLALALFAGCGASNGMLNVALTDAPVDATNVARVDVTFTGVSVNADQNAQDGASSWQSIAYANTVDLLALSNGNAKNFGGLSLPGGTTINQIRLDVSAVKVVFTDGSSVVAGIPSKTGLKIVKSFDVPSSGNISVMVDFDARKSLVNTGSGSWTLKPVLRAVVQGQAGSIGGSIPVGSIVYAYLKGSYVASEATPNADGIAFTASVTSAKAGADGHYQLSYLEPGTYDLVVWNGSVADSTTYAGKLVSAGAVTTVNIN